MDTIKVILYDLKNLLLSQSNTIKKHKTDTICFDVDIYKLVKKDKRFNLRPNIPGYHKYTKENQYWRGSNLMNDINIDDFELADNLISIVYALKQISRKHLNTRILLDKNGEITFNWTYHFKYKNGMSGYFGLDDIHDETKIINDRVLIYSSNIQSKIDTYFKDENCRFIVFPVLMYGKYENTQERDSILTMNIYDKEYQDMIRFTPLDFKDRKLYHLEQFDKHFKRELETNLNVNITKIHSIYSLIKHANSKTLSIFNNISSKYNWDSSSYWSIWFLDFFVSNPNMDLKIIIAEMLQYLWKLEKRNNIEYFISKYTYYLLSELINSENLKNAPIKNKIQILELLKYLEKIPNDLLEYINESNNLKKILDETKDNIVAKEDINHLIKTSQPISNEKLELAKQEFEIDSNISVEKISNSNIDKNMNKNSFISFYNKEESDSESDSDINSDSETDSDIDSPKYIEREIRVVNNIEKNKYGGNAKSKKQMKTIRTKKMKTIKNKKMKTIKNKKK